MIDPVCEIIISLSAAARMLNAHPRTVQRWAMSAKRRNRLETCVVGAIRRTSEEAVRRFVARSTAERFLENGLEAEAGQALRAAGLADEAIGLFDSDSGGGPASLADGASYAGCATESGEGQSRSRLDRQLDAAGF